MHCFVSRSVIDKPFFRYHDLQAGQVVEVIQSQSNQNYGYTFLYFINP